MSQGLLQVGARTRRFNTTEVKPNFINPCCFGEDFAVWLRTELGDLAAEGFVLSEPVQEDYGWGLWATRGKDTFWIALGSVQGEDGESESRADAGEWIVSVDYDPGLNIVKRLLHRPDPASGNAVVRAVRRALEQAPDITIESLAP